MKKHLLPLLLSASCAAAWGQSSVTVYGILDGGVSSVSGIRGGTTQQLVSGIMDGSRIGFRGNEDLGGGYRALFTLENRLELDTGIVSNRPISGSQLPDRLSQAALLGLPPQLQPAVSAVAGSLGGTVGVNLGGAFFDRQTFLGLVTPVGAVLAGRQYTPAFEVVATFDTLATQSSLALGQVASLPASVDIRLSNTIAYRIQLGGFSASAMAGAGENSTSSGSFWGAMAIYRGKGFSAGLGYNTRNNERAVKALTSTVFGVSVDVGPGKLNGVYGLVKDNNPAGLSTISAAVGGGSTGALVQNAFVNAFKQDGRLMQVGYRFESGPNTVYVAYNRFDDQRSANADTTSYGVTYSYALSKRTDINAAATRMVNSGLGQAAPGAGGYLGGVTASAGTDATSLALGVRHRF